MLYFIRFLIVALFTFVTATIFLYYYRWRYRGFLFFGLGFLCLVVSELIKPFMLGNSALLMLFFTVLALEYLFYLMIVNRIKPLDAAGKAIAVLGLLVLLSILFFKSLNHPIYFPWLPLSDLISPNFEAGISFNRYVIFSFRFPYPLILFRILVAIKLLEVILRTRSEKFQTQLRSVKLYWSIALLCTIVYNLLVFFVDPFYQDLFFFFLTLLTSITIIKSPEGLIADKVEIYFLYGLTKTISDKLTKVKSEPPPATKSYLDQVKEILEKEKQSRNL